MNAAKVKSLIPLYGGAAFLILAAVGVGVNLLTSSEGRVPATPEGSPDSRLEPAPPPPPGAATRKTPEAAPELSAEEIEAREREEIGRIILAQIIKTPEAIDTSWLVEVCQYIPHEAALQTFLLKALERGEKFDAQYRSEQGASNITTPADPRFYINEAREMVYAAEPKEIRLKRRAPGLLATGLYREYARAEGDWQAVGDDIRISYFRESLALFKALSKMAADKGEDPGAWRTDVVKLHEAAVLDHFLRIDQHTRLATRQLQGKKSSGKPITIRIATWKKEMASHLLALGRIYVEAASAETLYKRKQQEQAARGFTILAMVYQLTKSGEALGLLRESNRIQRYNIWKMGQATWKKAREAAASGDSSLAEEQYFLAKRRYLQCLSRLEDSRRETVYAEYRRLQQEIFRWKKGLSDEQIEESADEQMGEEAGEQVVERAEGP